MPIFEIEANGKTYEVDAPDMDAAMGAFNPNLKVPDVGQRPPAAAPAPPAARAPVDIPFASPGMEAVGEGLGRVGMEVLGAGSAALEGAGALMASPFTGESMGSISGRVDSARERARGVVPRTAGGQQALDAIGGLAAKLPQGVKDFGGAAAQKVGGFVEQMKGDPNTALGAINRTALSGTEAALEFIPGARAAKALSLRGAEQAGDVAGAATRAATQSPIPAQDKVRRFRGAGYKTLSSGVAPHAEVPGGMRAVESLTGRARLQGEFALQNQAVTNKLGREEIGLQGGSKITDVDIDNAKRPHLAVYREVQRIPGRFQHTPAMRTAIDSIDGLQRNNPYLAPEPRVRQLLERVQSADGVTPANMLEASQEFRSEATRLFKDTSQAYDPKLGAAYRQLANTLEDALDQAAGQGGSPQFMTRLRAARKSLAQIYDVDSARVGDNIDASRLAKVGETSPLSGRLKIISEAATDFPDEMRLGTKVNINPPELAGAIAPVRRVAQAAFRPLLGRRLAEGYQDRLGTPGNVELQQPEAFVPQAGRTAPTEALVEPFDPATRGITLADELGAGGPPPSGMPGVTQPGASLPTTAPGELELVPDQFDAGLPPAAAQPGDLTAAPPMGPQGGLDLGPLEPIIGDIISALGLTDLPGGLPFEGRLPTGGDTAGLRLADEMAPPGPAAGMPGIDFETVPQAPIPQRQVEGFGPAFELEPAPGRISADVAETQRADRLGEALAGEEAGEMIDAAARGEPYVDPDTIPTPQDGPVADDLAEILTREFDPEAPLFREGGSGDMQIAEGIEPDIMDEYLVPRGSTLLYEGDIKKPTRHIALDPGEDGFTIRHTEVNAERRGQGLGVDNLVQAARYAGDRGLNSDVTLTKGAYKSWQKAVREGKIDADIPTKEIEAAFERDPGVAKNPKGESWIKGAKLGPAG